MPPNKPIPRPSQRSALFVITSNPLSSPRPAEAVRIAAGIRAWQAIDVHVYLHDETSMPLLHSQDQIQDQDTFRHYLPLLANPKESVVLVSDRIGRQALDLWGDCFRVLPVTDDAIAQRAASSTWILRF
jgi:hypothetical protein